MSVLAHQTLVKLVRGVSPIVTGNQKIRDEQIQMASIDLSLGNRVHGTRAAALPRRGQPTQELVAELEKYSFELDLETDKLLLRGQTYIAPLNERVRFPKGFSAKISPKSSVGRLDVFVRLMADGVAGFDKIPEEYDGPLYLEITPLSFDILVRAGQTLVQMRIRKGGESYIPKDDLLILQANKGIVWHKDGKPIRANELSVGEERGIFMHVDLERPIIGFKARVPSRKEVSLAKEDFFEPDDFWIPIKRPDDGALILDPGTFYLLSTLESIRIPSEVCGDIAPYDSSVGEFRTHYAGFFDPGFGGTEGGSVGVMEVRGREMPFRLVHGQRICRMDFEHMDATPDILYGATSHYTGSGPSLAKFFRRRELVWEE